MTRTSSPPPHENKDWERDGRCIEYYPNRGFRISPDPVSVVFNTQQRLRSKATYTVINYWHLAWGAKAQCLLACQDYFVTETPLLKSPKSEYSCRSGGYHCARVCTSQHIHYPRMLLSTISTIHGCYYPLSSISTIHGCYYPLSSISTILGCYYPLSSISTILRCYYPLSSTDRCGKRHHTQPSHAILGQHHCFSLGTLTN